MSIAVVGGGLAGIAAALRLADDEADVTLVESRARLGGLTHSFARARLWVDNGQHVFLRCCTEYLGLLERLGVRGHARLQDRLEITVRSERDPRVKALRRNALPAPCQLMSALLSYRALSLPQRLRIAPVALALRGSDPRDPAVDAQFDQVVLAVPPAALGQLADPESLRLPIDLAERLGTSPIVKLHLILDRQVMHSDFVAAIDSPLQWIFDRTASSQLRDWAVPHLRALLQATPNAVVRDFFVTPEPEATFRATPGCEGLRPSPATPAIGLTLAGAWIDTGWPTTMEGAVRSSYAAAAVLHPATGDNGTTESAA